jgi:hypothetical protein
LTLYSFKPRKEQLKWKEVLQLMYRNNPQRCHQNVLSAYILTTEKLQAENEMLQNEIKCLQMSNVGRDVALQNPRYGNLSTEPLFEMRRSSLQPPPDHLPLTSFYTPQNGLLLNRTNRPNPSPSPIKRPLADATFPTAKRPRLDTPRASSGTGSNSKLIFSWNLVIRPEYADFYWYLSDSITHHYTAQSPSRPNSLLTAGAQRKFLFSQAQDTPTRVCTQVDLLRFKPHFTRASPLTKNQEQEELVCTIIGQFLNILR